MRNRIVGFLVIGMAGLIGFITFMFNKALKDIVGTSCSHGPECTMWQSINFQTNVSIGILIFVAAIGVYLIFFGKEKEIIREVKEVKVEVPAQVEAKKITKENYKEIMAKLDEEEKTVLEKVIESEGTIFQSDLVEKTSFNKVKVTRILDKLEGRNIIERKRRGMTNVVILKH